MYQTLDLTQLRIWSQTSSQILAYTDSRIWKMGRRAPVVTTGRHRSLARASLIIRSSSEHRFDGNICYYSSALLGLRYHCCGLATEVRTSSGSSTLIGVSLRYPGENMVHRLHLCVSYWSTPNSVELSTFVVVVHDTVTQKPASTHLQ